jgi:glycosyltransferase involved in cell wall biosynthesis
LLGIAHILSSFGVGGQERVALDLAVRQRAEGHRVLAISLAPAPDGPLAAEFIRAAVAVRRVAKGDGVDLSLPLRLAWLLWREEIDLVHTHNPQPLIYGAPAARLVGTCVVHTKHGANPDGGRRLHLRRAAARLTAAYVAVSDATAAITRRMREVSEERLHIIPNGIDVANYRPDEEARTAVRRELGIPPAAWVVGTVGRLVPEKDQALLLRAMAPLLNEDTRLVIVGDGPEAGALAAAVAQVPGGRFVHLTGMRRDVPRVLAALDTFALSSKTEQLPLVIPEAMASALPVVSTAVGGISTVVEDGSTGFLVPPGNEAALRGRLALLAAQRTFARECGGRGRALALSRYSADRMARDYLQLYYRVLGMS